jgi:hypothetical protein
MLLVRCVYDLIFKLIREVTFSAPTHPRQLEGRKLSKHTEPMQTQESILMHAQEKPSLQLLQDTKFSNLTNISIDHLHRKPLGQQD